MRGILVRAALIGLAAMTSGCVQVGIAPVDIFAGPYGWESFHRVDPVEAGERAVIGAALGTAIGTGVGASFAINPAIGTIVGAEMGAGLGAVVGAATAQPLPSYKPIVVPAAAIIPSFYDSWPPGYHPPPLAAQAPPPHPG